MTNTRARAVVEDTLTGDKHDRVPAGLDPSDWPAYRALAHSTLDEAMDLVEGVRERPVWQPVPDAIKQALAEPLPQLPQGAEKTVADAARLILPYATGNTHPRFFGWVHGSGTAGGVIAEMLAAAMDSNVGGRDHGAIYVERQVIDWCRQLFGLPAGASGLLVSGTSMATVIALTVARNAVLGQDARKLGLAANGKSLVAYTSSQAHSSVGRACELLGLGSDALRSLPADAEYRLSPQNLRQAIRNDKAQGNVPFAVIATAGTVNTGAIDPLAEIAQVCADEGVWLHVDGAFGALLMLSDPLRHRLAGIERADSIAFDFHKWLHVPYDAGCVLVRDGARHRETFASRPTYLEGHARGLAAGEPWPCDFGPELSRGFRALKVWFTLKEHGAQTFAASIEDNCRLARQLGDRVTAEPRLELLAPVTLNIACFRLRANDLPADRLDQLNEDTVAELQERGLAAPSTTRIGGKVAIRVNITNHRTRDADIELLLTSVLEIGGSLIAAQQAAAASPSAQPGQSGATKPLPFECLAALAAAMERPEIAAVCGNLPVKLEAHLPCLFQLSPEGVLRFGREGLANATSAAVVIRHAAELSALRQQAELPLKADTLAAHALLAARTAGRYLALLPATERADAQGTLPGWLLAAYRQLAGPLAAADLARLIGKHPDLIDRLLPLSGASPETIRVLHSATSLRVQAVNEFARLMELAAPVEHLLTHGGDIRIKIDARSGRNGYGSSARPIVGEIGFASSTASCISEPAYASVETMRRRLLRHAMAGPIGAAVGVELERIRAGVGLHSGADLAPGTAIVLTASGTDAELATLALTLAQDPRPLTSIVVSPEETGSGVPQATLGCHFSSETALGAAVTSGTLIEGLAAGRVQSVAIAMRASDGGMRPSQVISAEIASAVEAAVAAGRRVLLHVLDAAKSGVGAPDLAQVVALTARFGDSLTIVVDACQARLGQRAVAAYLARGWLVQMTGSKFWGGPPFSGALLVPAAMQGHIAELRPVLTNLRGYMARDEWPAAFDGAREALADTYNLGLVCRWQAALAEAERFASTVAPPDRLRLARTFAATVDAALADCAELLGVDCPSFDRSPVAGSDDWHGIRTIIPVVATIATNGTRRALSLDEAKLLHQSLARDMSGRLADCALTAAERELAAQPCQLGQPVKLGTPQGGITGALRICASARTMLAMVGDDGLAGVSRDLATVLGKMRLLLTNWDAVTTPAERM